MVIARTASAGSTGAPPPGLAPQEARQAMRYGAFRGPRVLTGGKIISATAPGARFYGDMYREADRPAEIRRAVREQIRAGADFIKVMTTGARSNELEDPGPLQLTEAELAAVTGEAHRMGFKVAAHAEGLAGCEAVAAGADTIEHGIYLHRRPGLLEAMAEGGQVLVPTLSGYYEMAARNHQCLVGTLSVTCIRRRSEINPLVAAVFRIQCLLRERC